MAFMYKGRIIRRLITHNGSFHSDDVFSTALLLGIDSTFGPEQDYPMIGRGAFMKEYHDNDRSIDEDQVYLYYSGPNSWIAVERVSSEQAKRILEDSSPAHQDFIMYDVGDTEFDHHKAPRETRPNGVPYCGFGKLWREFGPMLKQWGITQDALDRFDRDFVQAICLNDNEGIPNVLSLTVKYANNIDTHDNYNQMGSFTDMVDVAQTILEKWINNMVDEKNSFKLILRKEEGTIVYPETNQRFKIYDHEINPHHASKCLPDVDAVVYPHSRGGYAIESLSDTEIGKHIHNRWLAPEQYRGKNDPEDPIMKEIGMKFCHATGFITSFFNKGDAIQFLIDLAPNGAKYVPNDRKEG